MGPTIHECAFQRDYKRLIILFRVILILLSIFQIYCYTFTGCFSFVIKFPCIFVITTGVIEDSFTCTKYLIRFV